LTYSVFHLVWVIGIVDSFSRVNTCLYGAQGAQYHNFTLNCLLIHPHTHCVNNATYN